MYACGIIASKGVKCGMFVYFSRCIMSDSETPWIGARQASLSTGFSRQEYWGGLPFPSLGDLPDPGIEHKSSALAGGFFTTEPWESPEEWANSC